MGDRSPLTFNKLWSVVRGGECFLYITDGWKVYSCFIDDCDHLVSKTAMTRVEGENSRIRHYLGEAFAPDRLPGSTRRGCVRIALQNILLLKID